MKLKHTLLLGTLVHLLDGALAIPSYAQAKPAPASTRWEYIVDSADGTLYFGKDIKTFDGITFMRTKHEADPDGRNGDDYAWIQPYRCDAKLWKTSAGTWETVDPGTVGEELMKFACKGFSSVSGSRTVSA